MNAVKRTFDKAKMVDRRGKSLFDYIVAIIVAVASTVIATFVTAMFFGLINMRDIQIRMQSDLQHNNIQTNKVAEDIETVKNQIVILRIDVASQKRLLSNNG